MEGGRVSVGVEAGVQRDRRWGVGRTRWRKRGRPHETYPLLRVDGEPGCISDSICDLNVVLGHQDAPSD